jgi:glycosyltransferase involved in cell wall biosynthesis
MASKGKARMFNVVHVTHEAVHKIGGIGAVLEELISSQVYAGAVGRTILLCPLFSTAGGPDSRLGPGGEVLYSSVDGRTNHPLAGAFREIQRRYRVGLVYGRRLVRNALEGTEQRPEVLLIEVSHAAAEPVSALKAGFHRAFGITSTRYEHIWDYEQWVRLAEPGLAAVRALGAASGEEDCVIVAHEFMGLPTALAAKLHPDWGMTTVFYAHEVSAIRKIVEDHPGHDTMFYNVLRHCRREGRYLPQVFGDQSGYFRHALVEASRHLDATFAVGDFVVEELRFLSPEMAQADIRLVYNGIPSKQISIDDAEASKKRLQDYLEVLLGDRPDFVFTHVARMTPSKGFWRDINVMKYLEQDFRRTGQTAVLIVLSTEIGGPRKREEILHMERWWDWPVAHREVRPDLSGGEALFHAGVQAFNARSRNCKVLFINQFGFDWQSCGPRMPKEIEFWDIRKGSDLEFGQSIYEPFGISQLEALSFGSLCVMSNVCGCAGFVSRAAGPDGSPNVIIADYTNLTAAPDTIRGYLDLTREVRSAFDERLASQAARQILERLPRTPEEKAANVRRGYELARKMSWDVVARDYFLPALREVTTRSKALEIVQV